jgi:N-acetylglucosaminyl-diphospho-decaprenol L-rhamnosyltransferase
MGADPSARAALPISTITVGYRGADHLRRMLDSILHASPPPAQVILVDNASPEPLRAIFDAFAAEAELAGIRTTFVEAGANLGFGGGNTLGLEHATEPWVMLLNPDTELEPATLRTLFDAAQTLPSPCVVQPLLLFADRRDTINSAGIAPYMDGGFIDMLCEAPLERLKAQEPVEIAAATGACALFPREVAARHGFFDPDFFLYFEDVDLGLRWRRCGVRSFLVPRAVMFHVWHGSTGEKTADLTVEVFRNQIKTVAKNYPPFEAALAAVLWAGDTFACLTWRGKGDVARHKIRAAAMELRGAGVLLSKRRAVRALGPHARVARWIVVPKEPRLAHPPMVR